MRELSKQEIEQAKQKKRNRNGKGKQLKAKLLNKITELKGKAVELTVQELIGEQFICYNDYNTIKKELKLNCLSYKTVPNVNYKVTALQVQF